MALPVDSMIVFSLRVNISGSKELKRYEAMKKGLIDICIDLSTETKYEDMIKENNNAED